MPLPVGDGLAIPDEDIEWKAIRSSGPGGQNVNKVASAVQLRFLLPVNTTLRAAVKQRLTALDRFFDDAFPVFGEKWSEVDKIRQRHFLMSTAFTAYETRIEKVNELQDLYNRLAFGGIPHTPADIATDDAENLTVPGIR